MLRVAVPYGTLTSRQLRMLAHVARYYDKGYGHLSTRQNMQFNWPDLAEVPDILADLASVQMHAIQTSGNCIRNVTADQFAGVAADETVDGRPYCELIRQWSTAHPEFDWLPRKFKIAVNGSASDRAAIDVHDIGIEARRGADGVVFDIKVGGGLGRTPVIGSLIRAALPDVHLLTYLEAILRVYNRYGRRDNKHKARIKILVRAMSPEVFREQVDAEWAHSKDGPTTLTRAGNRSRHCSVRTARLSATRTGRSTLADSAPRRARVQSLGRAPTCAATNDPVTRSSRCRRRSPVFRPATSPTFRWTRSPTGRIASDSVRSASATNRTSCCRTLREADLHALWTAGAQSSTRLRQSRQVDRHHLLPRRRLLLARERKVDSDRRSHSAALRRHRLSLRSRRHQPEHLRDA